MVFVRVRQNYIYLLAQGISGRRHQFAPGFLDITSTRKPMNYYPSSYYN